VASVVILGAGFAGCATAWALARRGVSAVVLERETTLGRYASGRGAGLGRQLCEDDATSALAIRGAALLRTQFADAWSQTGGILCFEDAAHASEYVARAGRLDVAHEVIDRATASIPGLMSTPVTDPVLPARSAASLVITPVPQARSSTRSPRFRSARSSRSPATGAPMAGTKYRW